MKKYQSSYVLKQIKKKRIFGKKSIWIFHMDFPSNLTPVSNLAYVIIIQFVNIKLSIDSCLSKGFPGQLHEALRKCICMIFAFRV